ncbi:unnamed protein product [Oppiella nova]|uniref:microsomal epoxide hydrolase n=1 Tax=Oppiella nova TaxID=334625 RepID=A0A7R9M9P1_9ACAR|nr:unnamed protein product [Oppiella nova]CAG2173392.1 unnamed protein product [Oppiella nova]
MGFIGKIVLLGIVVAIGAVLYSQFLAPDPPLPHIPELWFGKNALKAGQAIPKDPEDINKFSVKVSDEVLNDLKRRLESARYVEPIPGTQFNYGFNADYLKKVVDHWRTQFNWRTQEKELNKFTQYTTKINGIDIHFLHVKPSKPAKTVVPLMVIHGWPGSVWEYYKAIPMLIEPTNDIAFEIICPSIPGYGFSEAPHQPGFDVTQTSRIFLKLMHRLNHKTFFVHGGDWGMRLDVTQTSRIFLKLMHRLNHKTFFVHGGDWGSIISKTMATLYPEHIRGVHTTFSGNMNLKGMALVKFITGMYAPSLVFANPDKDYQKSYPALDKFYFMLRESGYMHLQATKPDTIGAALIDSPVGLAAYILEKFSTWTNPDNVRKSDGALTQKFTLDELLTNIMIYWTSNNVASSMRYYKESLTRIPVSAAVPAAVADFPHELLRSPKELTQYLYKNLVQYTDMPRGGHFGAFEEPKLMADDLKKFVRKVLDLEANDRLNKQKSNEL